MPSINVDLMRFFDRLKNLAFWRKAWNFLAHYVGGIYHRVEEHHIFLLAGGLAFSMFVSIVPLVLIVFAVLGRILEDPSLAAEINTFIDRMIPYESYAQFVKDMVISRVEEFRQYKNWAGVIGLAGLLFAASTLFSSMRTILDKVFQVRADVSILMGKLRDFGLVLLVLVYFVVSTTVISVWEVTGELAKQVDILNSVRLASMNDFTLGVLTFVLIFIGFVVIYYVVPFRRPPRKVILLSALSATILWELAKELFGIYITHFVMLKKVYGAYALMVVVAFWIYYTSIVFIIGAEIGQLYRERLSAKRQDEEPEIGEFDEV